jgi:protein gp37
MSKSKIEWTESTWNPVLGSTKLSRDCDNCYAERMVFLFFKQWGGVNKKKSRRLLD